MRPNNMNNIYININIITTSRFPPLAQYFVASVGLAWSAGMQACEQERARKGSVVSPCDQVA